MLIAMDPSATWEHELPDQEDLPPERRVVLVCRYLTLAKWLRFRKTRAESAATRDGDAHVAMLLEAVSMVVKEVRLGDGGEPQGPSSLLDILTFAQLLDLTNTLLTAQTAREKALKNSGPLQPGSPEPSAAGAGGAGA